MTAALTDDTRAQIRALIKTDRGFAQRCVGTPVDNDDLDRAITAAWRKGYRSVVGLRDSAMHVLEFGDSPDHQPETDNGSSEDS